MAERSDGHWRDTGDDPKPIAVASGIAIEGKAQTAYRTYLNHMSKCQDCPQCAFQCDVAAALWREYRERRG